MFLFDTKRKFSKSFLKPKKTKILSIEELYIFILHLGIFMSSRIKQKFITFSN